MPHHPAGKVRAPGEKTKLTLRWLPINATEEERKTFDAARDGMRQGWSGSFDQLAGYLGRAEMKSQQG